MYQDVIIAGFGGQGVLLIGNLLAQAGMEQGLNVTFIPVYGAEMRGGTANCTVVLSDDPIGAPIVGRPLALIAMNGRSLMKFQPKLKPEGVQVVNLSLIDAADVDPKLRTVLIPVNSIAEEQIGNAKLANMVALGALVRATGCLELDTLHKALEQTIPARYHNLLSQNRAALEAGYNFAG
jgi:2-oxoglutarate ferredoxin oxidoreductase subunit gamma